MRHLIGGSRNGLLKKQQDHLQYYHSFLCHLFPEFDCSLVRLWFPSCPLLLSLPSVPTFAHHCVYPIISSRRPDDVICNPVAMSPLSYCSQMSVRKGSFSYCSAHGPLGSGLAVEFFRNSVPHQFLEASRIFVVSLPAQRTIHPFELLDVFFVRTHHSQFHVEITCNVEVVSTYCHHQGGPEEKCCTSLFKLP